MIDEAALIAALADKTILGAGLDVFDKEPHAPDALTAFPNVVLTPHIGGHTQDSHVGMQDCVIANLDAFFAGRPLRLSGQDSLKVAAAAFGWPYLPNGRRDQLRQFRPWQAGKDSLNNRFRACWLLLARLCLHSENPLQ